MAQNMSAHHKMRGRGSRQFLLLALLYGVGAVVSLYLFRLGLDKDGGEFCELLQSNCLSVIASDFGVLWDFPVAGYGAAYFFMQLGLLFTVRRNRPSGDWRTWVPLLAGNLLAVAASLFFIYVMRVLLKDECILCYAVHIINVLSLALLCTLFLQNNPRGSEEDPGRLAGGWGYGMPLLLALTIFLGLNLFATQKQLMAEQKKLGTNLNYFQYLYRNSPLHPIPITANDQVVGDPDVAIHQIVLIYKDGCRHCLAAEEKLAEEVKKNPEGVYLVMKNFRNFSAEELDKLGISRAPVVFINGKKAEGWDVPGFLDEFTAGCGC
jgi:uncharacterized membrane protein/glutaredoxin